MNGKNRSHVDEAFEMTGIRPEVRCEALDSILGTVIGRLFQKNRKLTEFAADLMEFGEDCNSGSLSYIRLPT